MSHAALNALFAGLSLGLSLIVAIGAQNAFVLRQALARHYVLTIILICAFSDAIAITAGVMGLGVLVAAWPDLEIMMCLAGAAFLAWYGLSSLRSAWRAGEGLDTGNAQNLSFRKTVLTCLAFTWLNPHFYLDTIVMMGSVSTNYRPNETEFTIGAVLASFLFFFGLGYGARFLEPVFAKPVSWRILDTLTGGVMFVIAGFMLKNALHLAGY